MGRALRVRPAHSAAHSPQRGARRGARRRQMGGSHWVPQGPTGSHLAPGQTSFVGHGLPSFLGAVASPPLRACSRAGHVVHSSCRLSSINI